MIAVLIVSIVLVIVIWALHKQINALTNRYLAVKIIRYALLAAAVLWVAFLAFMGIGEIASGDTSGSIHLVTALPFVLIIYLLAKR